MRSPSSAQQDRDFDSLEAALRALRIPVENHAFVKQICERIKIVRYTERGSYIKATRAHGDPALNISFGWTNGFISEAEARAAAGEGAACEPSKRGTGQWFVSHPDNRIGHGGGGRGVQRREAAVCPTCFIEVPSTGGCDNCS